MSFRNVPFFRPGIGEDEIDAVIACLRSGWLTSGPVVTAFERDFEAVMGEGVTAIAVNSATAALHLGLEAMGVGPGDEVIVPTLTFTATAEVVRYLGATPVLVDINSQTLCLMSEAVESAIGPATKVIMPVHFAGLACDMPGLRKLADRHGLLILDDAAHALPTRCGTELIGSATLGADASAFSFYANKTMTTGEGGMLVTRNPEIAKRARSMRLHGIDRDIFDRFTNVDAGWLYDVVAPGFKYNLTDMAAALGRVQLRRLGVLREARAIRAARYDEAFRKLPLSLPHRPADPTAHSWHLYIVRLDEASPLVRDAFVQELKTSGIGCSVHYRPLHQMTYWRQTLAPAKFPIADSYFANCVSLPLFAGMADDEQDYVVHHVQDLLSI